VASAGRHRGLRLLMAARCGAAARCDPPITAPIHPPACASPPPPPASAPSAPSQGSAASSGQSPTPRCWTRRGGWWPTARWSSTSSRRWGRAGGGQGQGMEARCTSQAQRGKGGVGCCSDPSTPPNPRLHPSPPPQDTNQYGMDRRDGRSLAALLRELSEIPGLRWVRILYAYPSYFTDELIDEIAHNPKVGAGGGLKCWGGQRPRRCSWAQPPQSSARSRPIHPQPTLPHTPTSPPPPPPPPPGVQVHRHAAAAHRQPGAAVHEPPAAGAHRGAAAQAAGAHPGPRAAHHLHLGCAQKGGARAGSLQLP
jgi:hypothetical protein